MIALVGSTAGAHAAIVPFSVQKRNRAGPDLPLAETMKSVFEPLKTMPVGLPPGIVTTRDCGIPLPSYSVDTPVPLSATQTKPD